MDADTRDRILAMLEKDETVDANCLDGVRSVTYDGESESILAENCKKSFYQAYSQTPVGITQVSALLLLLSPPVLCEN